jgi:hypothetical protein
MVSFSLRQRIFLLLLQAPSPVSFHLSQFESRSAPTRSRDALPELSLRQSLQPSVSKALEVLFASKK